ncbi:MAG TPA: hypothetical protein VIT18_04300 [Terrimicrobiaceae bacterium]
MTTRLSSDEEGPDPREIDAASDETPTDFTAPELSSATKDLIEWDEPPTASGTAAPLPEDDVPAAEQLVYEGADEADRERRIAAADPDFEP